MSRRRVLVLAGTSEATELAHRLDGVVEVTSSLAGVTTNPVERPGAIRRGGFGGIDGLTRYLADTSIDAIVDATHPFAAQMPFHAAAAARATGTPLCRLLRDPWRPADGDRWLEVADLPEAARTLVEMGAARVLLAVGRNSLEAFTRCVDHWFLVRSVEPPAVVLPHMEVLRSRGPFTVDAERELLAQHRIDAIVAKNGGGGATEAKLTAARELGLPVILVSRPPQPAGVTTVGTVDHAVAWVEQTLAEA